MSTKDRNQNPNVGDVVRLRLVTFNANAFRDLNDVEKVEIYRLDPTKCEDCNPDGRVLVQTVTAIESDGTGMYYVDVTLTGPTYVIGQYVDKWTVQFEDGEESATIENGFSVYGSLWYANTTPVVYDFQFGFQPNQIRQGSIKWLKITVTPLVPRGTDLERYYCNLITAGALQINISKQCGPCVPAEADLRVVVEDTDVAIRDGLYGYYKLDTTEMDCGLYDVWFKLSFMDTVEISPTMQLSIY